MQSEFFMQAVETRKSLMGHLATTIMDAHAANFWLQKVNPLWSVDQALGRITHKKIAAHDMVSLTLEVNRHFKMGQAGQHHPVIVNIKGCRYERTYSLTRQDDTHVILNVKKVDQGIVSTWLNDQTKIGDLIEFGQPYGEMSLMQEQHPLVLVAAGSGITPMYSLLKAHLKILQQPITLLYWVKKHEDAAFQQEFQQWATEYPHFQFKLFFTQDSEADARLNSAHVQALPSIEQSVVYACGPSGFVNTAKTVFAKAKTFNSEAFSLTPMISDEIGFVTVTLAKSKQTVQIPRGQSILTSLEQHNIQPTHGCRMGICNKCVCNKVQGATKNLLNGSENTEPQHVLKICINSAQSDLVIDL
jgi:ferredoxin-NADP reductase